MRFFGMTWEPKGFHWEHIMGIVGTLMGTAWGMKGNHGGTWVPTGAPRHAWKIHGIPVATNRDPWGSTGIHGRALGASVDLI